MFFSTCHARFRVIAAATCLLGTLNVSPLAAQATHGHIAGDGRFTPNDGSATFPPQPRSVENVRQFTPVPDGANRVVTSKKGNVGTAAAGPITKNLAAERNSVTATALADSRVSNLLGQRYAHIDTVTVKDKWGADSNRYEITFFSHSNNQTIRVSVEDGDLDDLVATPAAVNQPPLGETEMIDAIDLARSHWLNQGNNRIAQLVGYAIQTFQADGSPYPTRVAYVSFHIESPDLPELLTWVDLNNRQVIRAEVAQ